MNRFHSLLRTYKSFHDQPANQLLHWLGTPPIVIAIVAALYAIPMPANWPCAHLNVATLTIALAVAGYARLSWRVAIGMGLALAGLYAVVIAMAALPAAWYWLAVAVLFIGGWIFQLWGHAIQGASPRFIRQPIFTLVGTSALICQV